MWCSWHLTAVTKYHRLSGLQQCNLLSYLSGSPSEMGVTGLKPRDRLNCIPSRGSRGELIFLLSSFQGMLAFLPPSLKSATAG